MKAIYFILIVSIFSYKTYSQSADDMGKISLSIIMPDNVDGLSVSQLSKLQSKITQLVTASGLGASGYNNNFVIYPKFAIYETNTVEDGMQNITVLDAELGLFIKQIENNILFSSTSIALKGSGKSKQTALTNAISKISVRNPKIQDFIKEGKEKIVKYYIKNCEDILLEADGLAKRDQYGHAIGLYLSIPSVVGTCYDKAQTKAVSAYDSYLEKNCKVLLTKARTSIASQNYYHASNYLMRIDPNTSCYSEGQSLIKQLEQKITAAEKLEYDRRREREKEQIELQHNRLYSAREVAKAYYSSRPNTVNYLYLIR